MTTAVAPALPDKRRGFGNWLHSYRAMLRWELTNVRLMVPILVLAQAVTGAGFVLGFGLLIPELPANAAAYLVTGAAVVTLILVGAAVGPQLVAQQRMQGSYDYMWSLPVPRSAASAAWMTLNVVVAIPGMVAALVAGVLRFDVALSVSPLVVPAVLMTLACGTLLGYAISHAIPNPDVMILLSQVLIFGILGFSPINFPPENLPSWLAGLHDYLPFMHMANVVRDTLADGLVADVGRSYLVVGIWCVISVAVTALVLGRRK